MKHLKTITFVLTFAACSAANAMADEVTFNSPDVSSKLDRMVEAKMDQLVKDTYSRHGYVQIVEITPKGKANLETAIMKTRVSDVRGNRS